MYKNLQELKIEIPEYPGYYLNGFGNIGYFKNMDFNLCKIITDKTGTVKLYKKDGPVFVSYFDIADKYYPEWVLHRKNTTIIKYLHYCKITKSEPNKLAKESRSKHLNSVREKKYSKRKLDGRYKPNVDFGQMSSFNN
jgi:hypothetical protein